MPLRRIRRAGERLGIISRVAVIILERLEAAPTRLLDRLTRLTPNSSLRFAKPPTKRVTFYLKG